MNSDANVTANFKLLNPGPMQTVTGEWDGNERKLPFELRAGQWVKGEIKCNFLSIHYSILDPTYSMYQDLPTASSAAFTFQAQTDGTYYLDMGRGLAFMGYKYTLTYTVYS